MLLPVNLEDAQKNINLKTPANADVPLKATTVGDRASVEFKATDQLGFYELKAGETAQTLAVNLDASESDVTFLDKGALADAFKGLPVKTVFPGKDDLPSMIRQSRNGTEMWRKLLFLGLFVLLLESFLAR